MCLQVTGSLLDDDSHYTKCDPLLLTSPNSTTWEFKGVRVAIRWVGDTPSTSLTTSITTTCTRFNQPAQGSINQEAARMKWLGIYIQIDA